MEVSRITTGRVQLRQERVAVSGIVERAVETVRPLIDQHRHELTVSLPPQPIWLYADAARLEQVVVNLLNNAAKYTDEGGHIWLTVQQEGDACVLRVRDTGVGIAPELLPRIFDLFTQADTIIGPLARRVGHRPGSGATARGNAPGNGRGLQCFGARQRVRRASAGGGVSRTAAAIAPQETAEPTGPSLRVLVVDDNVDAAESWPCC